MDLSSLAVIAAWYFSNIAVVLLNKALLSTWDFKYPVFLTMCHMATCTLFTRGLSGRGKVIRKTLKSRTHALKVSVLAVVFSVSVVSGNVSLRFLPVSFNQAIGATTPFFTALLSFLVLRRKERIQVYLTLIPIVFGIIIASRAEPLFNPVGFLTCLLSTSSRAFKSVLQGLLLSNENEKLDSLGLLTHMSPFAFLLLFVCAIVLEPDAFVASRQVGIYSPRFVMLLLLNCSCAVAVNLTNFLVTKCTSPLTLQVLGNAKGVIAVVVSILVFKNPVSVIGMFGYAMTISGVVAYSQVKSTK